MNGHIDTTPGKTDNAPRTIDLDPTTCALLERWSHDQAVALAPGSPSRPALTRRDGGLLNPQTVSQCFTRAVARTTLPPITLHGLRHTHATLLLQAGVPLKVVSERLGHSTMATYQHVLPGMQADAAATLAALLADPQPAFYRLPAGREPVDRIEDGPEGPSLVARAGFGRTTMATLPRK